MVMGRAGGVNGGRQRAVSSSRQVTRQLAGCRIGAVALDRRGSGARPRDQGAAALS
jgi:hypothetical protein